jgi:hypothetical protein
MLKGMLVSIYTDGDRGCTNGPSNCRSKIVLVNPKLPEIFEANEETPAMALKLRDMGRLGTMWLVEPIIESPDESYTGMFQFGGNFVWTSDSRFRNISEQPVPIHDRYEPINEYPNIIKY